MRLWQAPEGRERASWQAHEGIIYGLLFVAHDRQLLSAGWDGTLAVWQTDGQLVMRRTTPSPVTHLAGDESAGVIVTGHDDGTVRVWRWPELSVSAIYRHNDSVRAVAYHRDRGWLASSGNDGRVFLWQDSRAPVELARAPDKTYDLEFSPDGRELMGGGWRRLFRWDLASGTLTVLPTEHHGAIRSIHYMPDGKQLASISRFTDSAVYLLDARDGTVQHRFRPHALCGTNVTVSLDGRFLASTSDDASIQLWDLQALSGAAEDVATDLLTDDTRDL